MLIGVNTLPGRPEERAGHWDRYLVRVLRACQALQGDTRFVAFTHEHNHHCYEGCTRVNLDETGGGIPGMRGAPLDRALRQHPVDRLLSPLTAPATARNTPQFLYALDLADLERGGANPRRQASTLKAARKACAALQGLVVPSEYLRHRCLELLETPLDRVVVAPPGVDVAFEKPTATIVEQPYIVLHVDALAASELSTVVAALEQLNKETALNLAVTGAGCGKEPDNWGLPAVRIEHLPDAQFAGLYQHARLFLYPALHDGCVMPLMEALRARAPVVAAKSGAVTEFAHAVPIYYNAGSASSLLQALRRTLQEDEAARKKRTQQGQQAVADFTWEQTAWRLLSAFSKV